MQIQTTLLVLTAFLGSTSGLASGARPAPAPAAAANAAAPRLDRSDGKGVGASPIVAARATSTTTAEPSVYTDCITAARQGMDRGCDWQRNYFTCTDGVQVLFTCTGGCYLDTGEAPRCNDGVAQWVGTY